MQDAASRISDARTVLFLDQPFFGFLGLRLKVVADPAGSKTKTMGTDGTNLVYFPEWVQKQSDRVLRTTVGHEAMHCALRHVFRANGRAWSKWNTACDHAVNILLQDAGMELWEGASCDHQYRDMSAEQIYAKLPDEPEGDEPGDGPEGEGQQPRMLPPPPGGGEDADGDPNLTEDDWQVIAEQASMVSRKHGSMPGSADRAIKESRQPRVNWREALRQFITNVVPSDYAWSPPNRRYVSQGLYLPGVYRENCPALGIAVDTSGSISQEMLEHFSGEVESITREVRPERLDVVYCDTEISRTESFTPDDPEIRLRASGGGGTDFQPPIDHFSEPAHRVAGLIYFTDGYAGPPTEPDFPVLWVIPEQSGASGPFGQTVRFSLFE